MKIRKTIVPCTLMSLAICLSIGCDEESLEETKSSSTRELANDESDDDVSSDEENEGVDRDEASDSGSGTESGLAESDLGEDRVENDIEDEDLECKEGSLLEEGECRAIFKCDPEQGLLNRPGYLNCGSINRLCVPATMEADASCGDCIAGTIEDEGACREVIKCSEVTCPQTQECIDATDNADAFCRDCSDGKVKLNGSCVGCAANLSAVSQLDEDECVASLAVPTYRDNDGDGFGSTEAENFLCQCSEEIQSYLTQGGDCNDSQDIEKKGGFEFRGLDINSDQAERCDSVDNDCDGITDEGCPEAVEVGEAGEQEESLLGLASGTAQSTSSCGEGEVMTGFTKWGYNYLSNVFTRCEISYVTGIMPYCAPVSNAEREYGSYDYSLTQSNTASSASLLGGGASSWNIVLGQNVCDNGSSSSKFALSCSGSQAMVGISGTEFSNLRPVCQNLNAEAESLGLEKVNSSATKITCPAGQVVTGLKSKSTPGGNGSSSRLKELKLSCAPLQVTTISE